MIKEAKRIFRRDRINGQPPEGSHLNLLRLQEKYRSEHIAYSLIRGKTLESTGAKPRFKGPYEEALNIERIEEIRRTYYIPERPIRDITYYILLNFY